MLDSIRSTICCNDSIKFFNFTFSSCKEKYFSFIIPSILLFSYFIFFGFYRSLMKFFDSKDSIFRALIGSFIFGFSWGVVYISQYEIIRTDFLPTVLLQSLLLSSVFYAFIQITRRYCKINDLSIKN